MARNSRGNIPVIPGPKIINTVRHSSPSTGKIKAGDTVLKIAIYPGSFDPVTTGHLNIIERAAKIFDKLIVCVMVNAGKNPMFTLEERQMLIRRVTAHIPNVEVDCSDLLLADYARQKGSCVIVKGLRAGSDFENEFQMAMINRKINSQLDTMFLTADHQ